MITITTFRVPQNMVGEGNNKRLISSLNDKEDYWVHYRLLETYLRLGLRLKKDKRYYIL